MTLRDLTLRLRALIAPRRVEHELDEELAFHIAQETQKLMATGLSPADARRQALARFGSMALVADQCRDARGTAFIDTLLRDIQYALRAFRRAPVAAATIVGTVALGLGAVAVVFTFYNALFLQADAVRNPDELFTVQQLPAPGAKVWMRTTRRQYDALRQESGIFADALGMLSNIATRIDGRPTTGTLVTGNFFQVLGVSPALGRTLRPADDEPFSSRPVVVLSHKGWIRLLAEDPTAVGQRLLVNGRPLEIVGVMSAGFRGLGVTPDYWAPLSALNTIRPVSTVTTDDIFLDVIGRLKPGMSAGRATAGLAVWAAGNPEIKAEGRYPKTFRLIPGATIRSTDMGNGKQLFAPLFFAFGLILLIGCANVANLLLARGVARQREIGIRLSLGASRARVIRQLLTESLVLAVVAAIGAFAISRLILAAAGYVAATTFPAEIAERMTFDAPAADWRLLVFLLAGAMASTMFFGLVPALQATRLELVRTMRGEVTRDAAPGRARNALIALQVGAAALLLISAAIFLRGAMTAATAEPGLRTSDTLLIDVATEAHRSALLHAVTTDSSVSAVAASMPNVSALSGEIADVETSAAARLTVGYWFASPEYFDLLDIAVLNGRAFTSAEQRPEAGVVIVSEHTAHRLWPAGGAVGQVLQIRSARPASPRSGDSPQLTSGAFTVVGVVRDVQNERNTGRTFSIGGFGDPQLYLPTNAQMAGTSLTLRVHGDPEQARQVLLNRLTGIDPALDQVRTLRTIASLETYLLRVAFWVTATLGGLALLLTLSGLFGVLSYIVAQRTTEIGVRMALGANRRDVVGLVLRQSVRPVAIGLTVGGGLAGLLASALMSTRAASDINSVVHVFDPASYAASVLCIVTACLLAALVPALRAARIHPGVALKRD